MIKGMTGFGTAQLHEEKFKGIVEIKSVNHRYLDVVCYLPGGFSSLEDKIRALIHKSMERGRITVSLKIMDKPTQTVQFSKEIVKTYFKYADILKKEFHLKDDLSLSELIRLPGVMEIKETSLDVEALWSSIEKCLKTSVKGLMTMRLREGKSLAKEIHDLLKQMLSQSREIQKRAQVILKEKKKVLSREEFSALQKSNDVNEEIARLAHYIEELKQLLKADPAVGKKLDFIAQEMQRETNTIGSKLQDRIVINAVIALKSKIEKIRELSQNIE